MADNTINVKIKEAYDTESNWSQNDPVLLAGQIAISSDKHGMYKVGDGTKTWSQLDYASIPASTLASEVYIDGVRFEGQSDIIHYGTCDTAAATATKVVNCTGFKLVTGAVIYVRFTVTNTAAVADLKLNVNSTGGKSVKYRNANIPAVGDFAAERTYCFIYDGTYWQWVGDRNTNDNNYVRQENATGNTNRSLLLSYNAASSTDTVTNRAYKNSSIYANPSTGKITATGFVGNLEGQATKVNNHTVESDVPQNAVFTDTTYSVVTQSADGLMSSSDKTLLDQLSNIVTLPMIPYSSLPSGNSGYETYFREWLAYISANHWDIISKRKVIAAPVYPNIRGWVVGYVYGVGDGGSVNETTGIPENCHFVFYPGYLGGKYEFGSTSGEYFYREIQNQNGANVLNVLKTGDTMTGALTLYSEGTTAQNYPAQLKFSVKDTTTGYTYSNAQISVYPDHNTSASYGTNMVIASHGNIFLGSGEAPTSHYALYKGNTGENAYFSADSSIYLQSNANTIGNRVGFRINTAGGVVPTKADVDTDSIGSIGTSSAKWKDIYAVNLNGVAIGDSPKFTDTTALGSMTGTLGVGHGGTGATSFTSGELLIGNGTNAVGTRTIKNLTAKGNLGWTSSSTDIYIPTVNTLAYWDGRYNDTKSNLTYCSKGAFGNLAIKDSLSKSDVGLGNVDNKSSETIRSEITSQNVTTALGYTPINKAGDTDVGQLKFTANQYHYNNVYGINMNNSDIIGVNSIVMSDASNNAGEGIKFYRDGTNWDTLWAKSGVLYFSPNTVANGSGGSTSNSSVIARFDLAPTDTPCLVYSNSSSGEVKHSHLRVYSTATAKQAGAQPGWYRIAKLTSAGNSYANFTVYIGGVYNGGTPLQTKLYISTMHGSCYLAQIGGCIGDIFTKARLAKESNGVFYFDVYQNKTLSSSAYRGIHNFDFIGQGSVETYSPTEPLGTEETAAKEITFADGKIVADLAGNATTATTASLSNALKSVQLTNEDLDTLTPGNTTTYYAGGQNEVTNSPLSSGTAFGLVVYRNASGFRTQILTSNTGVIYYRVYANSAWGDWTQWKLTDTKYPYYNKYIDDTFATNYRLQTKGDTDNGAYIANIRNNTASVANSPQYGSGLAFGMSDTHGYLYTSYSADAAYIGGGSAGKLNWISRIYTTNYKPTKSDVGLGDVDNKSSETIRSEITSQNVTTALGYTPVNKAGDTMTGNLSFTLNDSTQIPLKIYGGNENGQGISVGAGAATIVGAGESAKACESLLGATSEQLWLTSDNHIYFYTNCGTIANKVGVILSNARAFYPDTTSTGSLGTSSNKWGAVFADDYTGKTNGYTWDISSADSTDTWIPVFAQSTIKHRVSPTSVTVTGSNEGTISLNTSPSTLTLKRRAALVGQSQNTSNVTSNPWYKVADCKITTNYIDANIMFCVTDTMANGRGGLLKIRCKNGSPVTTFTSQSLEFLVLRGYSLSDFVLGYTTGSDYIQWELWTRIAENWQMRRFTVLSEGDRVTDDAVQWTLYDTVSDGSEASYTSGLTAITASLVGSVNDAKQLTTARTIDGVSFNGTAAITHYGTCPTAAATQAKVVTCDTGFTLVEGARIYVKFTNAQTYNGAPTLNVNSTGAVSVKRVGTTNLARYQWQAGEVVPFVYDGTNWIVEGGGLATTTYYGKTQLNSSMQSTSTGVATTPYTVNVLRSIINGYSTYSASATYAVGDRVQYGTAVYECKTAITTAEAWNADHWTALPTLQSQIETTRADVTRARTTTLASGSWSSSAPYTQEVTISGVKASDSPVISAGTPSTLDAATYTALIKNFAMIDRAVTSANKITFYCYRKKPTADIPLCIKGV